MGFRSLGLRVFEVEGLVLLDEHDTGGLEER